MKNVDFIAQMELFLEALFKDAAAGKNAIVFNYNPNYPRYLSFEAHKLIGAIKNLSKFYLNEVNDAKLLIAFNLVSYSLQLIHFDIRIKCDAAPKNPNERLVREAGELAKELNAKITRSDDGFDINISIPLPKSGTFKRQNTEIPSLSGKNAIIACDDENLFLTLSHELSFTGLKLSKQKSLESLNLHIRDAIFRPDIIFIQKEYLDDKEMLEAVLTYQKLKNFYIVVICKGEGIEATNEKIGILRQPFTSDSLHETLEMITRSF